MVIRGWALSSVGRSCRPWAGAVVHGRVVVARDGGVVVHGWGIVVHGGGSSFADGVLSFVVGCCRSWVGWPFVGGCRRPWSSICGGVVVRVWAVVVRVWAVVVRVWAVVVRRGSLSSMCGMMLWGVRCCPLVAWSSVDGESSSVGVGSSSSVGHGRSWVGRGGSSCATDGHWLSMWHAQRATSFGGGIVWLAPPSLPFFVAVVTVVIVVVVVVIVIVAVVVVVVVVGLGSCVVVVVVVVRAVKVL